MTRYTYLVTITKDNKLINVTEQEIRDVLYTLTTRTGMEYVYGRSERHGLYKQLHHHCLVQVGSGFIYADHTMYHGMRIHYKRIIDIDKPGVRAMYIRYIDKNRHRRCTC